MEKRYTITIEEIVSQSFEVYANDIETALNIAKQNYKKGEFVLEPGNLIYKQISADGENGDYIDWREF